MSLNHDLLPAKHKPQETDELQYFKLCLKWTCVDQSNPYRAALSWSIFFLLVIIVPILSHLLYSCTDCDEKHRRSYDAVVQISLSVFAAVSFLCLSSWFRKYGLARFLFLDKLYDVSGKVREDYALQFHVSAASSLIFVFHIFCEFCWIYFGNSNRNWKRLALLESDTAKCQKLRFLNAFSDCFVTSSCAFLIFFCF